VHDFTGRRDDVGTDEVVAGQPMRALQPADAPPSVRPATPVDEIKPPVLASPCSAVAASKSAQVAPGSTTATRRSGSRRTPVMADKSMTSPSQLLKPPTLCPPARTAGEVPVARAKFTAAAMSETVWHRAIRAGRVVTVPFHTARASSYDGSSGVTNSPPNDARRPAGSSVSR
jgi:hypothetical protein